RLVEAEFAFQLLDEGGRQAARADIALLGPAPAAAAGIVARAGEAAHDVALPLHVGDDLLDRPAGDELDQREVDDHHADQRGDHQQQAAENVGTHAGSLTSGPPPHATLPHVRHRTTTNPEHRRNSAGFL